MNKTTEQKPANRASEVMQRIYEMTEAKKAELEKISKLKTEAEGRYATAGAKMADATAFMDLDAFEKAKQDQAKAKNAMDMYEGRYAQLEKQEYISEEESDGVIDSLLAYEDALEEQFMQDLKEPLAQLRKISQAYTAAVDEAERTIRLWETTIHANYNTRGNAQYFDKETGESTNRSPVPYLVHKLPYKGCKEAHVLKEYLERASIK